MDGCWRQASACSPAMCEGACMLTCNASSQAQSVHAVRCVTRWAACGEHVAACIKCSACMPVHGSSLAGVAGE
eukprot:365073-Chlamydomonas_euryale.AAC.4